MRIVLWWGLVKDLKQDGFVQAFEPFPNQLRRFFTENRELDA